MRSYSSDTLARGSGFCVISRLLSDEFRLEHAHALHVIQPQKLGRVFAILSPIRHSHSSASCVYSYVYMCAHMHRLPLLVRLLLWLLLLQFQHHRLCVWNRDSLRESEYLYSYGNAERASSLYLNCYRELTSAHHLIRLHTFMCVRGNFSLSSFMTRYVMRDVRKTSGTFR